VTVAVIPVSRDQLKQALLAGRGDIAAGDITVTEDLAQEVAFTTPVLHNVKQVVVIPKDAPPVPEPATGQSMGVGDIHIADANVHAGAKYMRQLVDKIPNANFDDQNRALFAFAAYNAGPGKIEQLRKLAVQQKLDPNVWFNNVERVAAQQVGQETVRYVRNIYKYYVAYQLLEQAEKTAAAARQSVPKTP
jgi:membrane-bound lytic murein transglycosylase MltF